MVQQIFDVAAMRRFRARALRQSTDKAGFLLAHAASELAERLNFIDRKFQNAIITSGNGAFFDQGFLAGTRHAQTIFTAVPAGADTWPDASEEILNPAYKDADLALSLLSLHETNDTPGALTQIRMALKPDGLFMGVVPGGNTLFELRESLTLAETEVCGGASPRIYPFIDVRTAGALLQRAGFALPVTDEETVTVRYPDMFALMRELRSMGASNALKARTRKPATKSIFIRAAEIYQERHGAQDGRVPATFSFVWMSGWSPSEMQQKPARRGSASISLAHVLKPPQNGG